MLHRLTKVQIKFKDGLHASRPAAGPRHFQRPLVYCRDVLTETSEQSTAEDVTTAPTVSVIICAYTMRRWEILREGIASIGAQTHPPLETILVIDHNSELWKEAQLTFPDARLVENVGEPGVSASRNTGVGAARGEILAFLDDDAVADEMWLEELIRPYSDPFVIGTGGMPMPRWEGKAPRWLPSEFYWTIGCGYRGLPTETAPVRNQIGATMSFRKAVFDRVGNFHTGLGRIETIPFGCEETELAIRALQAYPKGVILHVPDARVEHFVPLERTSWSYYRSRCWLEGHSKERMTEVVGSTDGLSSERAYTLRTLPTGVLRGLWDALRGDLSGLGRAGAIVGGFATTAAGYLAARLTRAR
jgi:GT2 family glycosyltransferase